MPASTRKKSHRDLIAWQASMAAQLRRAAVSIAANFAEGFGRSARGDYLRHLSISCGSLREIETHLEAITLLGYLPRAATDPAERAVRRTAFLLRRLQTSMGSS